MSGLFAMAGGKGQFLNKIGSIDQKTADQIDGRGKSAAPSAKPSLAPQPVTAATTAEDTPESRAAKARASAILDEQDDLLGGP